MHCEISELSLGSVSLKHPVSSVKLFTIKIVSSFGRPLTGLSCVAINIVSGE